MNKGQDDELKIVIHPEKLAEFPAGLPNSYPTAKAMFDAITEGSDKFDADKVWTLLAKKVGPMQTKFTEDDWAKMIALVRECAESEKKLG